MKLTKLSKFLVTTTTLTSLFAPGLSQAAFGNSNLANNSNAAGIIVSIEEPTIQTTQLPNPSEFYTVDFNSQSTGTAGFSKTNAGTTYEYSSDLDIQTANQWGGAEGSKFITQARQNSIRSYKIDVSEDQKYFGFWWSAGDAYNKITFKKDGATVAEFRTKDLVDFIQSSGVANTQDYYGNPAYNGSKTGHQNEPFSYVNIFFKQGSYDEIVIATLTEGGAAFESDNHTFSAVDQDIIGTVLPNSTTPAAINDSINTDEDTSKTVNVIGNDIDPNGDLTISSFAINGVDQNIGTPITLASGALLTVESDGQATYDPNGQFEGFTVGDSVSDTFTYTITDTNGNSDSADVAMTINGVADAPAAENDNKTTDEDSSKWIPVLLNDSDPDSAKENLTITAINNTAVATGQVVTLPSGATVMLVERDQTDRDTKGKYTLKYNPQSSASLQAQNDGETTTETFSYVVTDPDGLTGTASVEVEVEGITDFHAD